MAVKIENIYTPKTNISYRNYSYEIADRMHSPFTEVPDYDPKGERHWNDSIAFAFADEENSDIFGSVAVCSDARLVDADGETTTFDIREGGAVEFDMLAWWSSPPKDYDATEKFFGTIRTFTEKVPSSNGAHETAYLRVVQLDENGDDVLVTERDGSVHPKYLASASVTDGDIFAGLRITSAPTYDYDTKKWTVTVSIYYTKLLNGSQTYGTVYSGLKLLCTAYNSPTNDDSGVPLGKAVPNMYTINYTFEDYHIYITEDSVEQECEYELVTSTYRSPYKYTARYKLLENKWYKEKDGNFKVTSENTPATAEELFSLIKEQIPKLWVAEISDTDNRPTLYSGLYYRDLDTGKFWDTATGIPITDPDSYGGTAYNGTPFYMLDSETIQHFVDVGYISTNTVYKIDSPWYVYVGGNYQPGISEATFLYEQKLPDPDGNTTTFVDFIGSTHIPDENLSLTLPVGAAVVLFRDYAGNLRWAMKEQPPKVYSSIHAMTVNEFMEYAANGDVTGHDDPIKTYTVTHDIKGIIGVYRTPDIDISAVVDCYGSWGEGFTPVDGVYEYDLSGGYEHKPDNYVDDSTYFEGKVEAAGLGSDGTTPIEITFGSPDGYSNNMIVFDGSERAATQFGDQFDEYTDHYYTPLYNQISCTIAFSSFDTSSELEVLRPLFRADKVSSTSTETSRAPGYSYKT